MKRTTKKLTGKPLEQFLRRFFLSQPDIDEKTADALARAGRDAFASARVTAPALARRRHPLKRSSRPATRGDVVTKASSAAAPEEKTPAPAATSNAAATAPPASPDTGTETAAPFDPYSIGLVPTFQREGADGLLTKLAEISSPDQLRKMARAQQVALPADLRRPEAQAAPIREAIVKAVAKRIADRRAAAG
jgi:hypothetical protein